MKIGTEGAGVIFSMGKHNGVVAPIDQTTADMIRSLEKWGRGREFGI